MKKRIKLAKASESAKAKDKLKIPEHPLVDTVYNPKPNLTLEEQKKLNGELLRAVIDNDEENVKKYLRLGGDANYKTNEESTTIKGDWWFSGRSTLLIIASTFGYTDTVEELIKQGADVNIQNKEGWTALIEAARNGRMEIVKLLIEKGAMVNLQMTDGETALMWAAWEKYTATTSYLLSVGANPFLKNKDGNTAFDFSNAEIELIIYKYEKLWKRAGKKNAPKIFRAVNKCNPDAVYKIFVNQ